MPRRSAASAAVRSPRPGPSPQSPSPGQRPQVRSPASVSNLSLGSGVLTIFPPQAHQTRVSALSSRAAALSGQLCGNRWRRSQHPVPVSCCLSATGIRFSGLPAPAGEFRFPHGRPTGRLSRRTPSGLSRSACDRCGRGGRPLNPGDGGALPAGQVSPGRHLPPSSGRSLFSRLLQPTGESANDEASSRIHSRSPVRPSPACGPRMEREPLGISPGFAPRSYPRAHARAGTVLAHWTGYYAVDISQSSFDKYRYLHATSCRTTWFSQDACTGVWIMIAFG